MPSRAKLRTCREPATVATCRGCSQLLREPWIWARLVGHMVLGVVPLKCAKSGHPSAFQEEFRSEAGSAVRQLGSRSRPTTRPACSSGRTDPSPAGHRERSRSCGWSVRSCARAPAHSPAHEPVGCRFVCWQHRGELPIKRDCSSLGFPGQAPLRVGATVVGPPPHPCGSRRIVLDSVRAQSTLRPADLPGRERVAAFTHRRPALSPDRG